MVAYDTVCRDDVSSICSKTASSQFENHYVVFLKIRLIASFPNVKNK